ncbi:MAG TPA: TetR/AcrR family transcriptional regulator [Polyangia bacterium]|nr:TetR/AcrR family transcriptional regulator [Polyangia bacterium]
MARPRAFDIDAATDRALLVFWQKGYEGTTLDDLTAAMDINRPSLYAAFGNKEGLFQRVLERYVSGPGAGAAAALEEPTAREAVRRLLRFYADAAAHAERPRGCLLVQGALACGDENQSVRAALADMRRHAEAALVTRLERAKRDGELPAGARPADLARYVWTICHGLAVQAAGGATCEQLRRVVAIAMRAWPAAD